MQENGIRVIIKEEVAEYFAVIASELLGIALEEE